jgi:curli biogenesis system outer membrane secretion channel CsgG
MALDVRVVDVASGRVLTTQRIPGLAITTQASVSTVLPGAGVGVPVSLSMYRSTPMELAIRDCIQKSVMYVVNNTPQDYFRHR